MSARICPRCGNANSAQMNFCSNCGQSLNVPGSQAANRAGEPPPTIMVNQRPPINQNPPVNPFSAPSAAGAPPSSPPPKKASKAWIFGLVGCLGLLLLLGIGAVVGGVAFFSVSRSNTLENSNRSYPSPTPYLSDSSNEDSNSTTPSTDGDADSASAKLLMAILESRSKVGSFDQTSVKGVAIKDYFPLGEGAAQATYSNGSKYVYLTVGQFGSMDVAKDNFEDQLSGIKKNGGKVTYRNTAADGTISAIYENRGYYFAEYCNTSNFCNRIHSDNRPALKSFFESYAVK